MITEKATVDEQTSLYTMLDACLKAVRRRNVSYIIVAHTGGVASISLYVTGKKGMATKDVVLLLDENTNVWSAYSQGYKYTLNSIMEITNICKTIVNTLGATVLKF